MSSPPPKKYKTSNGPAEQPYLHGHAEQPNGPVEKTPIQRMNQPYDGVKTVHESQYENHTKLYDALKASEEANEEANEEVKGRLSFSPRKGRQRGKKPVIYMAKTQRRSNRRRSNRRRNNTRRMRKIRGGW